MLHSVGTKTLLALAIAASLYPVEPVKAQECEAIPVAEFNKRLDAARNRIYLVKYDEVKSRLEGLEALLPCLTEVLPRETLSRIYLYRGVVAFNQGDDAAAGAAFRQAVAVDRGSRWDERFGQRPREIFIESKEAALLAPKGNLKIPELQDGVLIYLDGEPLAAGMTSPTPPGEHFLQLRTSEGTLQGWLIKIPSGADFTPELPAALVKKAVVRSTNPPPRENGNSETPRENGNSVASGGSNRNNTTDNPPVEKPPRKPFEMSSLRPVAYGLMGLGGAGLAAGLGGGAVYWQTYMELYKKDDSGNSLYYSDRSDANKEALLQKNSGAAILADVGFAAALVLGGGGTGLFFLTQPADPATMSLLPVPVPGGGGLLLSGQF